MLCGMLVLFLIQAQQKLTPPCQSSEFTLSFIKVTDILSEQGCSGSSLPWKYSTWNSHQGCHASAGVRPIARVAKPSLEAIIGIETTTLGCSLASSVICGEGSCHLFLVYFYFFSCTVAPSNFAQVCLSFTEVDDEKLPKEVWGIRGCNSVTWLINSRQSTR